MSRIRWSTIGRALGVWMGLCLAPWSGGVRADVPATVAFQLTLLTSSGAPVAGTYAVAVRLYATQTATSALWTETLPSVTVAAGLMDAVLGAGTPLPADLFATHAALWVGVSVDGEPELPRRPITAVPYALHAATAQTAVTASGLQCSGCLATTALAFDPSTQAELDAHAANPSAHHTRYTASEAVAAMGGKATSNPLHHDRFTNAEAVAAMGAKAATNPLHHDRFTDAEAVAAMGALDPSNPLNHDRYTEDDAIVATEAMVAAVDGMSGGTVTGDLYVDGSLTVGGQTVCTSAGNCATSDTLAALQCGEGQVVKFISGAWTCAVDLGTLPSQPCQGKNFGLQWNGTKFVCVDLSGQTVPNITDSWGFTWDGLERPPLQWQAAHDVCETEGGRLPTHTELVRVNFATGSGEVGQSFDTAPLWTEIEWQAAVHGTVTLNNGTVSSSADTTARAYRCVWPPSNAPYFWACHGPAGSTCWGTNGEKKRYRIDKYDRPPLPYNAAVRECMLYHAHVPYERDLTEEIQRGLPYGSNQWVWTSDMEGGTSGPTRAGIVRWNGVVTGFTDYYSTYATWSSRTLTQLRRFRCIGIKYDAGTNPVELDTEFTGDSSGLKGDDLDRAVSTYAPAVTTCFEAGGHLPTERDLHELIADGLPYGSGAWLWTSDQEGHNGTNFLNGVVKWSAVDRSFHDASSTYSSWAYKNKSPGYAYRCVYYPIDTEYAGPSSCNGGCYVLTKPGGGKTWIDTTDRAKTQYATAVRNCISAGGHLPTERDMTEAIRAGLPNGTKTWVFTSDSEGYNGTQFLTGLVRWTGVQTAFTDLYSTYASWGYKSSSSTYYRPYRCMWTNELR